MFCFIFGLIFYGLIQSSHSLDNCDDANPNCIEDTIQEMNSRLNYLIYNRSCDHNAVFAKVYTIMTQYLDNNLTNFDTNGSRIYTNYFYNPQYISREDRLFANYYFNATDKWINGQNNQVPQAWNIAFQAADNRELSALGNAMMGINAHINRDLPYVLASLGLTYPDGTSGKADHDLVNTILAAASTDAINAIADEFDPTILQLFNPITNNIFYQFVVSMRSQAWINAKKLVNSASNANQLNTVKSNIENDAASKATALRLLFQVDSTSRDAYCLSVHGLQ